MENLKNMEFDKQVNRKVFSGNRLIFSILTVIILVLPVLLNAQQSNSISITASATVVTKTGIEMIAIKNLEIDLSMAENGIINVNPLRDPQVGLMMIKGKPETSFSISFMTSVELPNTTGRGTLKLEYQVFGLDINNQAASEPIDAAVRNLRFNSDGEYYLWIGGQINVSKARPGNYEGEFTLEVEYI